MSKADRLAGRLEGHADVMRAVAGEHTGVIPSGDLHGWSQVMLDAATQVRQLAEQRAALLEALQWYVENDDTNIGQPGNEFWELGLERARAAIALAQGDAA